MSNLETILRKVHQAIFSESKSVELEGKKYPIEKTSKKGLRCVYYNDYFIVEQNPNTDSHWADKAKSGDKITWAIKGNDYVANIHNGKYKRFKDE